MPGSVITTSSIELLFIFVVIVFVWIAYSVSNLAFVKMRTLGKTAKVTLDKLVDLNEFKIVKKAPVLDQYQLTRYERINTMLTANYRNCKLYLVDAELYWLDNYKNIIASLFRLITSGMSFHAMNTIQGYTLVFIEIPTGIADTLIMKRDLQHHFAFLEDFVNTGDGRSIHSFDIPSDFSGDILKPGVMELISTSGEKFSIGQSPGAVVITGDFIMLSYLRITEKEKLWNVISFSRHLAGVVELPAAKTEDGKDDIVG
jgi:hypothetical protein